MNSLESQWRLPNSSSIYRVVWWYDAMAKDTRCHVPMTTVMFLIPKWLRSNRFVLKRIDEALNQRYPTTVSQIGKDREVEQLGKRIADAIREGWLVVVQALPAPPLTQSIPSYAQPHSGKGGGMTILVLDEGGDPVPNSVYRIQTTKGFIDGVVDSQGQAHKPGEYVSVPQNSTPITGITALVLENIPSDIKGKVIQGKELQIHIAQRIAKCDKEQAIKIVDRLPVMASAKIGGINKRTGKPYATLNLDDDEFYILKGGDPRALSKQPAAKPDRRTQSAAAVNSRVEAGKPARKTSASRRKLPRPNSEQRRKDTIIREQLKTKLYGLDSLYHNFYLNRMTREELTCDMKQNGFANIEDFQNTVGMYVKYFLKETVAIALDMMIGYEHFLDKQEQFYRNPQHAEAFWNDIGKTRAREYFSKAKEVLAQVNSEQGKVPQDFRKCTRLLEEADQFKSDAEAEMNKLAREHPLLDLEQKFDVERIANARSKDSLRNVVLDLIYERQENVVDTYDNILADMDVTGQLDTLLEAAYSTQAVSNTLFQTIVHDYFSGIKVKAILKDVALTLIAIVAGFFTGGAGAIAVAATTLSVGIGVYGVFDAYRQYEVETAAHGAKLLSDDPSFAWVIVAVAGVLVDAHAAKNLLTELEPAVKALNEGCKAAHSTKLMSDGMKAELAILENHKALKYSEKLKANVMKAARAEVKYRQAMSRIFSPANGRLMSTVVPGMEEIGKLVVVAYYLARRGVLSFEKFMLELGLDVSKADAKTLLGWKQAFKQIDATSEEITAYGKSLDLSDEQIFDFIQRWSESRGETQTIDQLKKQMFAQAGKKAMALENAGARGAHTAESPSGQKSSPPGGKNPRSKAPGRSTKEEFRSKKDIDQKDISSSHQRNSPDEVQAQPRSSPQGAALGGAVKIEDCTPNNLGEKLEAFAAEMKQLSKDDVAGGGSIKITAPPVQGGNNTLAAQSVELIFSPNDLYVREIKVGDVLVRIPENGVMYPRGGRVVLNEYEIEALIRDFNSYVKRHAAVGNRQISLSLNELSREMPKLPDLIAMLAEGTRFPELRKHIKSLLAGGDGVKDVITRAGEDMLNHNLDPKKVDVNRLLPRYYINGWENLYLKGKKGEADFRQLKWSHRPR